MMMETKTAIIASNFVAVRQVSSNLPTVRVEVGIIIGTINNVNIVLNSKLVGEVGLVVVE